MFSGLCKVATHARYGHRGYGEDAAGRNGVLWLRDEPEARSLPRHMPHTRAGLVVVEAVRRRCDALRRSGLGEAYCEQACAAAALVFIQRCVR